jgi:hypothetical protein
MEKSELAILLFHPRLFIASIVSAFHQCNAWPADLVRRIFCEWLLSLTPRFSEGSDVQARKINGFQPFRSEVLAWPFGVRTDVVSGSRSNQSCRL